MDSESQTNVYGPDAEYACSIQYACDKLSIEYGSCKDDVDRMWVIVYLWAASSQGGQFHLTLCNPNFL